MTTPIYGMIAKELAVKSWQVEAAVSLFDEGNTVPFVARYRKEKTGELTDEQLRTIEDRLSYLRNVETRKEEIIRSISEQGQLTDALADKINQSYKLQELEDIYLPYRPKRRTRAMIAKERGLEPLAELMVTGRTQAESAEEAAKAFISQDLPTVREALQGASDILAEMISDSADVRARLRKALFRDGAIHTELVGDDQEEKQVFLQYDDYEEPVKQLPSHRILAINRGEKLGFLKVTLQAPDEHYIRGLIRQISPKPGLFDDWKANAVRDAYKRLIFPSLERDIRRELTEKADEQAIRVFGVNLRHVLLQPPLAGHVIMGLDPGYRNGCKTAVIDAQGNVLDHAIFYLTMSKERKDEAKQRMAAMIRKWRVTLLSIGNGTASYETEQFVSELIEEEGLACKYVITNEAGASIYSASKLAVEELPDLDVSIRGAVSIARRVQDPMAESVKIDPKSIGVGQYQHDVNQKQLAHTLDQVVESVVNHVGVELNTASPAILKHVAGITATIADNIVAYRKEHGAFQSRKALLKVARLGPAAFTQCAGFLRIKDSQIGLDRTSVHPESYELAAKIIEETGCQLEDLLTKEGIARVRAQLDRLDAADLALRLGAGEPTVRDIMEALKRPGRDPRDELLAPIPRAHIVKLEDLQVGTVITGTIQNVVDFGAFVDLGIKTAGLLHRSQFCKRNQQPEDIVAVGQRIEVEILTVDSQRNRIGLTLPKATR